MRTIFIIGLVLFPYVLNKTLDTFIELKGVMTTTSSGMEIATKFEIANRTIMKLKTIKATMQWKRYQAGNSLREFFYFSA